MWGKVTSRNHQASTLYGTIWLHSETVCGFVSSVISLLRTLVELLKLGKLDNEEIVTGREFQIFGPQ